MKGFAVLLVLLFTIMVPTTALADPSPSTTGGVPVEIYDVDRWDTTNHSNRWDQPADDYATYACGWYNSSSAICRDYSDGAVYLCTFSGGRVFCQHDGASGVAMAQDERQTRANTLARGIANRGLVPVMVYENGPC